MSAPTAENLAEVLKPLLDAPRRSGVFCDIDGTLAPIVQRADDAKVPETTARLLASLARRYGCVACISGRSVAEARRLVGVGGIAYAGMHGVEMLWPGATKPEMSQEVLGWADRVRGFVHANDTRELRTLRVRIEDKGPIWAYHWRGAPDEEAAQARVRELADAAEEGGFHVHWGRKVLEVRPPLPIDKGQAVRRLAEHSSVRSVLFGGDDVTDLDAFAALDDLVADGRLDNAVRVGLRSDEGPAEIVDRADLVVEGVDGFRTVLRTLAEG
ncbi:MAG TPA: trehalose-phosphatase [Thermoleophilaceae bacterium]|nr:trehalose-phosphatase [Thermoleophilaceae bacterium]